MKIYFLGQKGLPAKGGGVERHVEELASRIAANGHEVFAYARKHYTGSDADIVNGVHLIYTPAIYTKHLEAITHTFFSILHLATRKADIVHVHAIGPSLLIPLIRLIKPRTRIVATIHCADYNHQKWGYFARLSLRLGERIAAKFSDAAITVSKELKYHVQAAYQVAAHYIPNGVPVAPESVSPEPLAQWGLAPGGYIVSISRLVRHKGIHFLIEAFKQMETDKKLVIVGGTEYTDDYVQELHALAANDDRIIFTDKQSGEALASLFAHAYCFVHPSLSEGLSIALLEAFSYSQAVLASDIPENREVAEGVGMFFRSGDVTDLKDKLIELLEKPEETDALRRQGRSHVQRHYDWDQIAAETTELYTKVAKAPLRKLLKSIEPTA